MDIYSREKRSEIMSKIRSRGNRTTELRLVSMFRSLKITGWRRHIPIFLFVARRSLPLTVRPDFVFKKDRLVVFVEGCFWHGCPRHSALPATSTDRWRTKIEGNVARDARVHSALRRGGWNVVRIWEHELATRKAQAKLQTRLNRLWNRVLQLRP
jgi:DNA mismatch endonuclease (patch repair protein)